MSSLSFKNVYINDFSSIVGPYEKNGNIDFKNYFEDFYFNEKDVTKSEIKMQQIVIDNLMDKNNMKDMDIDIIVGGDLMNQLTSTSYALKKYNTSFLGVYSACATFVESMIILSNMLESRFIKRGLSITSSHNLTSEKQFRFPIEYGCLKPKRSTFTATGSLVSLLSNKESFIKVEGATLGKIVDMDISDVYNMGAVMAPAAAKTIYEHLTDFKREVNYYDVILTGDLGEVGTNILKDYMQTVYNIKLKNHLDAGSLLYKESQETFSGASGPVALPLVLFNKILKQKKYKKILVVGTGSLHSPLMCNQKNAIPAIAHAVSLEVLR